MLKLIWRLCVFKAYPDEIPRSVPLLLSILCIHFSVVFFIISIVSASLWIGVWKTLLLEFSFALYTAVVLYWRGFLQKFIQTVSGLLITNTFILTLIAVPYIIVLVFMASSSANWIYLLGATINGLLLLLGSVWLFILYSRFFKHVLEITVKQGLLLALILFGFTTIMFTLVKLL